MNAGQGPGSQAEQRKALRLRIPQSDYLFLRQIAPDRRGMYGVGGLQRLLEKPLREVIDRLRQAHPAQSRQFPSNRAGQG